MLTRQGWTVFWGGLALPATGRLLGIGELYVFGTAALLLVLGTLVYVHLARLDLEVHRRVFPARVHAGSTSRVEIRIRNLRRQATPLLRLTDRVSGTSGAEMLVPPVEADAEAVAGYRLPTSRRGVLEVGPLQIAVSDPFGLARSSIEAAQKVEVTIYPRVDEVQPVPLTVGHDPLAGARQLHALSHSGDDFYALRPYVMGDDLRRIHWPSTARHDELLVCQHEQPWQGRTTVLVDVNRATHSADSLEVAISAAASLATANTKRTDLVRLVTTDGRDSGFGMGRAHLEGLLEHLALVQADARATLTSTIDLLERDKGSGGALVVIVGDLPEDRTSALAPLRRRAGSLLVVQVARSDGTDRASARPDWGHRRAIPGELPTIRVGRDAPFAAAWDQAIRSRAGRGGSRRPPAAHRPPSAAGPWPR